MLLSSKLEEAGNEDDDTTRRAGRLAIDGGYGMTALLEREAGELFGDGGGALDLATLEGEHGGVLVEKSKARAIGIEGLVVEIHELLGYRLWIHLFLSRSFFLD